MDTEQEVLVDAHSFSESVISESSRKALEEDDLDQVDSLNDINDNHGKFHDVEPNGKINTLETDLNLNSVKTACVGDIAVCGDCDQKEIRAKFEATKIGANDGTPLSGDRQELEMLKDSIQTHKVRELFAKDQTDSSVVKQVHSNGSAVKFKPPVVDPSELCPICSKRVYHAEKMQCDNRVFHKACFRCKTCGINLRLETSAVGPDGAVYCKNHHLQLFNNMAKNTYNCSNKPVVPVE